MEGLRDILKESGAVVCDTSGREINVEAIEQKLTTEQNAKKVSRELSFLDNDEKQEWLSYHKLIGNRLFKNKKYEDAVKIYMEALIAAKLLGDNNCGAVLLCNLSSCMLSLNKPENAENLATQALLFKENHQRALERRAQARYKMGRSDLAEEDLKLGLRFVEEVALKKKMIELSNQIAQDNMKAKELYKRMINNDNDEERPEGFSLIKTVAQILLIPYTIASNLKNTCKKTSFY
ncbi:unnamed protein product [Blepharisma stoltei]|uniref:Tetratricopeptide repeat protein n=1 Tax=Blepharisma stoltei TaxID=1481888 RepID=A0AAU9JVW1_9CILI|nr:unnamed protein product [Blepharisma stoltei]